MNLKVHLTVIGVMAAAIIGGYGLLRHTPEGQQAEPIVGDHYIRIIHAHWGMNCNRTLREAARYAASTGQKTKLTLVEPNNVLPLLRTECERRAECNVPLRAQLLGDPAQGCLKELDIGWRCFSYDKLQKRRLSEGQTLSLRCD